jgi:peptidoglycan-N-acetylglucosamine deacetylase
MRKRQRKLLIITFSIVLFALTLYGGLALPWRGISMLDRYKELRSGRLVYSGSADGALFAVTFDDGPDPRYTPRVLDILKKHHVKATFFVCGHCANSNPALLRRIVAEGHAVGNHTETHPPLETRSAADVRWELDACDATLRSIAGVQPTLFRPPRGELTPAIMQEAARHGYRVVLWTEAFDRVGVKQTRILSDRVLDLARPGGILLMHDGSGVAWDERAPTVRELDYILTGLEKRGLQCVTVPGLLDGPSSSPESSSNPRAL